jgi:hypothetical protein
MNAQTLQVGSKIRIRTGNGPVLAIVAKVVDCTWLFAYKYNKRTYTYGKRAKKVHVDNILNRVNQ